MKISKEKLTFLKNAHIITLELIHDMLEVKQHINNYQRNTNKKYGLNLEKDEVINREIADMIIINTLGKLNMLPEQSYFLRLVRNTEANSPKIRKAEKFAEKANLADKIIESLDFIFNSGTISFDEEELFKFIKNQNVQNIEYFSSKGLKDWFSNRVKWLSDTYKEGRND
jgi:mannose-1-phosphate guanylyltransferase